MELSERERKVVAALQFRADMPLAQAAGELGMREHTVRRCVEALLEREVIRPHVVVNLTALGYTEYEILFSLAPDRPGVAEKFISAVVDSEEVSWLAPTAGDYQYVMLVSARDIGDLGRFLAGLAQRFGNIVCEKAIGARLSLTLYRRRHLYPRRQKVEEVEISRASECYSLDPVDQHVLTAITANPATPWRRLARETYIPYSTFLDRVTRLKSRRIIVAFAYLLNFSHYGMHMYRLLLDVKGVNTKVKRKVQRFCENNPWVTSLTHSIGAWDFVVAAEAAQPDEIVKLTQQLYELCGHDLQSVRVLSRYWNIKWNMYPFRPPALGAPAPTCRGARSG